jgi:hypothetical protein
MNNNLENVKIGDKGRRIYCNRKKAKKNFGQPAKVTFVGDLIITADVDVSNGGEVWQEMQFDKETGEALIKGYGRFELGEEV